MTQTSTDNMTTAVPGETMIATHDVATTERERQQALANADKWRNKLIRQLEQRQFHQAAAAVESLPQAVENTDAPTMKYALQQLRSAMAARMPGWLKGKVQQVFRDTQRVLNELSEKRALKSFNFFQRQLDQAEWLVKRAWEAPRGAQCALCDQAEQALDKVMDVIFPGWALGAIERLIQRGDGNAVSQVLAKSENLALEVVASSPRTRATVLLNGMVAAVEEEVRSLQAELTERRQKAQADDERRKQNRRNRIGQGPQGMGGNKPGHGTSKPGPRAASDPNRGSRPGKKGKKKRRT